MCPHAGWGKGESRMLLAYSDDSGDSGYAGSTDFIVMNCILVEDSRWKECLDLIIALRQDLKRKHGIPVRAELKAEHLVYGRGPVAHIRDRRVRHRIYEYLIDYEADYLPLRTFSVGVAKRRIKYPEKVDAREWVWRQLMDRLNTYCRKSDPQQNVMLFPDAGHGMMVRKLVRQMRRFNYIDGYYGGRLELTNDFIIEDPIDKASDQSYFTQVADWNAYAAHRSKHVAPNTRISPDLWDRLGSTRILDVNALTRGRDKEASGIVIWPRQ